MAQMNTSALPDTVTGAVEIGLGVTLIFVALTSGDRPMSVMVAGLGLAVTAGMCHSYQDRRGLARSMRRTLVLSVAGLAALVVLALTVNLDASRGAQVLLSPLLLVAVEVTLRWLAERSPAPTPWHLGGWVVTAAAALVPLVVPAGRIVPVACLLCAVALLVMGATDIRRLTAVIGPTPPRPDGPPNPIAEWVRDRRRSRR